MSLKRAAIFCLVVIGCGSPSAPDPLSDPPPDLPGVLTDQTRFCPPPPVLQVTTTALTLLPGAVGGEAYKINESGEIVGVSRFDSGNPERVTLWRSPTHPVDITPPGIMFATALDINASGSVIVDGCCTDSMIWSAEHGARSLDAGLSGNVSTFGATALNDAGVVVGNLGLPGTEHAGSWSEPGQYRDIGTLPGGDASEADDINARGQVAGIATRDHSGIFGLTQLPHVFLYTPGQAPRDLGMLRGTTANAVTALNDRGDIVGSADSAHVRFIPWRWTSAGGFGRLHPFTPAGGADEDGQANDINAGGDVAGAQYAGGHTHAVLWTGSTVQELRGVLPGDAATANGLDAHGHLVGRGDDGDTGRQQAMLWTVAPAQHTLSILDATIVQVNAMAQAGKISQADAQALLRALQIAQHDGVGLLHAQSAVAKQDMKAFVAKVQSLASSGKISAPVANALLIDASCSLMVGSPVHLPGTVVASAS